MTKQEQILMMAALIASVRTARFEPHEFNAHGTPRVICQIGAAIDLAEKVYARVEERMR